MDCSQVQFVMEFFSSWSHGTSSTGFSAAHAFAIKPLSSSHPMRIQVVMNKIRNLIVRVSFQQTPSSNVSLEAEINILPEVIFLIFNLKAVLIMPSSVMDTLDFGCWYLINAGHNVHHEPQSTRRIFTALRSDNCAFFVILVTLHL